MGRRAGQGRAKEVHSSHRKDFYEDGKRGNKRIQPTHGTVRYSLIVSMILFDIECQAAASVSLLHTQTFLEYFLGKDHSRTH